METKYVVATPAPQGIAKIANVNKVDHRSCDVIVVGAGPAGSSAAFFSAKKGKKVILLDKNRFPRPKACGDGVIGRSLPILEEMGILGSIRSLSFTYRKISFFDIDGKETLIEMPTPLGSHLCIKRYVFDDILLNHAKEAVMESGGEVLTEFKSLRPIFNKGRMIGVDGIHKKTKKRFLSKIVIGAGGYNCPIAKSLENKEEANLFWRLTSKKYKGKFKDENENCVAYREYWENVEGCKDHIEIHFIKGLEPGYFWIFPISDTTSNVGLGIPQLKIQELKGNLKGMQEEIINSHEILSKRFKKAKKIKERGMGGMLPLATKDYRMLFSEGAILVGDAASLVNPLSGEGICSALISGRISAEYTDGSLVSGEEYQRSLMAYLSRDLNISLRLRKMLETEPFSKAYKEIQEENLVKYNSMLDK